MEPCAADCRSIPLSDGCTIGYHVSTDPAAQNAIYNVTVRRGARKHGTARYVLRWPGALQEHPAAEGCTIVQIETRNGLVVVAPTWPDASAMASFSVTGRWKSD